MEKNNINIKHKDRLFKYIFGNPEKKEWTLSLFNAISGLDYTNAEDIKLTTIDNFIYMGMKNDISFLVCDTMNFYEHQSTLNPNIPVRFWIYAANVYSNYIQGSDNYDLYGPKLQKLPTPNFICFYNGIRKTEDTCVLRLSDCFSQKTSCELTVTMININWGHNDILNTCKPLEEYSLFVHNVRKFKKTCGDISISVSKAIDIMPDNSLLKKFFLKNKSEVTAMCLTEYDEEKTKASWEDFGREKGRAEGLAEGEAKGREKGQIELATKLIETGKLSLEEAASLANMSVDEFIASAKRFGIKLK